MKEAIYLVTGAAGFLGINVCQSLVAQGKKVRCLVLEGDPAAKRIPREAETVVGNLLDAVSLDAFFDVPDGVEIIVLHIASLVTVVPDWNQRVYDINVGGTKNIIRKCLECHAGKLVYVSSTGAIPELPKGRAIGEPDMFDPAGFAVPEILPILFLRGLFLTAQTAICGRGLRGVSILLMCGTLSTG
jgi:dihydroflavonol-4-reductase